MTTKYMPGLCYSDLFY